MARDQPAAWLPWHQAAVAARRRRRCRRHACCDDYCSWSCSRGRPPGVGVGGLRGLLRELGGGGESDGWRRLLVRQSELLQGEVLVDVEEGGEGPSATERGADVGEALVEAADYVEDEGAVGDDFPESAEVVDHLLEAAAVLGNGEVALDEVVEPRLKLDGAYLPVPKELGLDGEPGVPGSAALGGRDLSEVVSERTEDPGLDDAIHPIPNRGGDRGVEVDMVLEGELAEGQ
jgi:hypothetical protein